MHQKYLTKTIIFLLVLAFPICGNWLFLYNSGELLPIEEVVNQQLASKDYCIVGLATRNQGYYYKRQMYHKINPEILILGSSRVMQFRKEFFSQSMLNVGGSMSSINEGFSFVKDTLTNNIPKVVVIGLDYWWFNENASPPSLEIKPPPELNHRISLRSYLLPYTWLWKKKISFYDYLERANPFYFLAKASDKGIGVDGIMNRTGFAPDGSYVYSKTVFGKEKDYDENFEVSMHSVQHNGPRFEYGNNINAIHFQNFMNLIKFVQSKNVKVILFIPPVAPTVAREMEKYQQEYAYINELREKLEQAGLKIYDFHQPTSITTNDCEFIDGIHAGDIVYSKILAYIAEHEPILKGFIDLSYIGNINKYYRSLVMIPRIDIPGEEVDFLKIGCNKEMQFASLD